MNNPNAVTVGAVFFSASGVEIKVTNIEITSLHMPNPSVRVSYDYDDNGNTGSESVSINNFLNNLAE